MTYDKEQFEKDYKLLLKQLEYHEIHFYLFNQFLKKIRIENCTQSDSNCELIRDDLYTYWITKQGKEHLVIDLNTDERFTILELIEKYDDIEYFANKVRQHYEIIEKKEIESEKLINYELKKIKDKLWRMSTDEYR